MKVVSLFSGAGGLDLGFIRAGHTIIWANDVWKEAVETYRRNLGNHIICRDIREIGPTEIPDCDIVVGGFPCQGFSVANITRNISDERNHLYLEFIRVLKAKQPHFFLAENVKGILSLGRGRIFEMIVRDFSSIGYVVKHVLLNAADFGVPQARERVFILGIHRDYVDKYELQFPPQPTHARPGSIKLWGEQDWVGVGEALRDIPEPGTNHNLVNHEASKYKLRFNGYLGHRHIDPAMPSPTLTSRGDDRGGVVVIHHPSNQRRISAREAAIIQSFPIDYKFAGPKTSVYRQVSNAVPPKLAEAIAHVFPLEV